jgi:hypothetical protein
LNNGYDSQADGRYRYGERQPNHPPIGSELWAKPLWLRSKPFGRNEGATLIATGDC